MKKINLDDLIESLNTDLSESDLSETYVVDLENFNGITSQLLEQVKKLSIDIKFKVKGDLYGLKKIDDILDIDKYNYSIEQMQQIIAIIEELGKNIPKSLTPSGKFIYLYKALSETIIYKDTSDIGFDDITGNSEDRSVYACLVNGEGVCVGISLTLKNLANYYGIDCLYVDGIVTDGVEWRRTCMECGRN